MAATDLCVDIFECFAVLRGFFHGFMTPNKAEELVAEKEDHDKTPDSESPAYASELSDSPLHIDYRRDIELWE